MRYVEQTNSKIQCKDCSDGTLLAGIRGGFTGGTVDRDCEFGRYNQQFSKSI